MDELELKPYQAEYLALLSSVNKGAGMPGGDLTPEQFMEALRASSQASRQAVARGTQLLRENLFPLLDDILSASEEEIGYLERFAGQLMAGQQQKDAPLHYRIHLALTSYARRYKKRDMLIRELYLLGMSLYNMETMLTPNKVRLYATRMRMYFAESASHFETDYDEITDPETRGYIHRSMGNIVLSYEGSDKPTAQAKLAAMARSISILSDPDVRAKTPSLPWDRYLYMSHQERTTMLSYLRSGSAEPEVFAQVLESAQIIQARQVKAARERNEPLQPRWQYAYFAAQYHCGAMLLPEFLDALYALSTSMPDDDYGVQSMFSHVSAPALYMEYCKKLPDERARLRCAGKVDRMLRRLCRWIARAPSTEYNEQLMFNSRQALYGYLELPGAMSFFDLLQNIFAARHPTGYAKLWKAGRVAETLCRWAVEDCPERLAGMPDCPDAAAVAARRDELAAFANQAGRLYDAGMIHFFNLVLLPCRGLFEEDYDLMQLHAWCGAELLSYHPSTAPFADVAHGHHCHYDEKGGYPMGFSPRSSPYRAMIHIVSVADALTAGTDDVGNRYREAKSFGEIVDELREGSGTQYAPYVVDLLQKPERQAELQESMARWTADAYRALYRRRARMAEL